ncbi:hypothetical protein NLU13_6172 [Sarocladium strictum]|uniref:Uncharacterized protein n=1 Tax=Sarocladium strictum TaxID=5046 RepID=A0AA39GFE2_SARSR|nr:hypothetical protein NLU13_6172 [Sarocladium strictum]
MAGRLQQAPGGEGSTSSSAWFQQLRPLCVEISQLAIRHAESPDATRQLIQLTGQLYQTLEKAHKGNALTSKLAEYVFFPLSHIFRQLDVFPHLLVESCLRCLQVLVRHGWGSEMSGDLARQLLSLLVIVIDGKPGAAEKDDIPEETLLEGLRTMSAIFSTNGFRIGPSLTANDFLPTTGHAISVVLDSLESAPYAEVQLQAAEVVEKAFSIFGNQQSQQAYEAFLPGTVSALAKLLATPSKYKNSVLARAIGSLVVILTESLGDMRTEQVKWSLAGKRPDGVKLSDAEADYAKWVKASAAQIKIALATVMKLHKNESSQVRQALYQTCISLLDECHASLENCAAMLVETAIILSDQQPEAPNTLPSMMDLVLIHPELGEVLKSTVYSWMSSLARQMQANDDRVKQAAFINLTRGVEMLKQAHIESSTLEDALSSSIIDSMVVLLTQSRSPKTTQSGQVQLLTDGNNSSSTSASDNSPYRQALIAGDQSGKLRSSIIAYISAISTLPQRGRIVELLLQNLQGSPTEIEAASFWLSFEISKAAEAGTAEIDAMLNLNDDEEDGTMLGELYSYSVDTLSAHTDLDDGDWRLDFIAMEVVAHAAAKSGEQFRPELIDVLFPIATFLGSDNEQLRQQAIATLNGLAISCQYGSVAELLIANVDYVVNSVSLRLNSLDISPASIAVLTMMIRLSGPRLIPFLDDVVESIFAALENYHGYTSFVENLFSVLNEIVGSAVKADKALLTSSDQQPPVHRKVRAKSAGLQSVLDYLHKEERRLQDDEVEDVTGKRPDGPFKRFTQSEPEEEDPEATNPGQEVAKPANPPTYQLLLRIVSLTQHYLTSPTPKLRRSLLDVLSIAAPVLGADEDAFLPLVNTVWPVVFDRLYDSERYVSIEACRALSSLCAAAGDFLGSRFKTVWGEGMGAWCRRCKLEAMAQAKRGGRGPRTSGAAGIMLPYQSKATSSAVASQPGTRGSTIDGGLGQHASQAKIWEAVISLLVSMVTYVRIDDEMFDEILELLADEIETNEEAREALEVLNSDSVWLMRFEKGRIEVAEPPEGQDLGFTDVRRFLPTAVSMTD